MKRILFAIVLVGFLVTPCLLKAAEAQNFAAVKLGLFMPNGDDNEDELEGLDGFDNTVAFELAYGRQLMKNFGIEIGVNYYSTDGDQSESESVGSQTETYTTDLTVTTWSIPITAKFIYPATEKIDVFAGLGVGYYISKVECDWRDLGVNGNTTVFDESGSESDTGKDFGYHIVAGADYKIMSNVALGGEVKWTKADVEFDNDDGESYDCNVGGTTVSLVAKYLF